MGADGAEEGCDQPPAAGVRVLGLWDPIPPPRRTCTPSCRRTSRAWRDREAGAWGQPGARQPARLPGALLLWGWWGVPWGEGREEGATRTSRLALGTGTAGLPRDPTYLRTLFSGDFPPSLVRKRVRGIFFLSSFKNTPYKLGILVLYLWYKLWIFPSSLSFVFWACLWWPFFPTQIFIFYFYVVKCTNLSLYSIWTSVIF